MCDLHRTQKIGPNVCPYYISGRRGQSELPPPPLSSGLPVRLSTVVDLMTLALV